MNRSKIEWTDYTWNPITGCTHGCHYCYARRMAQRLKGRHGYPLDNPFAPTFHSDRLDEPSRVCKPSKIFTVSMGEMFGDTVPCGWVHDVMRVIRNNPRHTFQLLTKQPQNLHLGEPFPDNVWMGLTVDGTDHPDDTDLKLNQLRRCSAKVKFISFEPLLGPVNPSLREIDWIIIGQMTGHNAFKTPSSWVLYLEDRASFDHIPVFMKNNLGHVIPKQEWPKSSCKDEVWK